MKVTALIVAYNARHTIEETVNSLSAQSFADFEIVLVDDGSTDGTVDVIRRLQEREPRLRLVALEQNVGRPRARNAGLAIAEGEYVAVADADDVNRPDRFRLQVTFLDNNPDVTVVSGQVLSLDREGQTRRVVTYPTDPKGIDLRFRRGSMGVSHAACMYRRDVIDSHGGYLGDCLRAQDLELFLRLHRDGFRFANLSDDLLLYRNEPRSVTLRFWITLHTYHEYARYRATYGQAPRVPFAEFRRNPWALRRVYTWHLLRFARQKFR